MPSGIINDELDKCSRGPDPTSDELVELVSKTKNLGFAFDLDSDRVILVINGKKKSSDITLGLGVVKAIKLGIKKFVLSLDSSLALEKINIQTRLLTAIKMEQVAEPYIRRKAIRHLQKGRVVIFGGGTGNPYFTTDTAATLRAIEIEADVILKGTRVDGIYTADPEKDKTAKMYDSISFDEVYKKGLKVMDMTAFTLCRENNLPIKVFNMNQNGNLKKVCSGKKVGTLVNF